MLRPAPPSLCRRRGWALVTPAGAYCLQATLAWPTGPVWFTSRSRAERYLRFHAQHWGPLVGVRIRRLRAPMDASLAAWSSADTDARAGVAYLDLRPSLTGVGLLDGEVVFTPEPNTPSPVTAFLTAACAAR